jgi:hypothetical protein
MKVLIATIDQLAENKFIASMSVDGLIIETEINENSEPIRSFNFGNLAFKDVLEMAGQMTRFSKAYWEFRDKHGEDLPWDYGDHETYAIENALKHHGLRV